MEPESPFSTWLEQKNFERLQSEGLRVRELRYFCQGSFSGLVEECYRQWRNGHLIVSRKWGNWQSEEKTVIYLNSACLLPDDLLRWQKSSSEVTVYRVATWNVNSIRSRMEVLINWLESWRPDVLCIQETKVEDANFPVWEIEQAGYQSVFVGQKTYNGVAILSRQPLEEVCRGFENGYDSENARIISAIWQGIRLVNVYVPQGQDTGTDKFLYKLEFLEQLLLQIQTYRSLDSDMLILGDFNVALEPGDVIDPENMLGKVSYHPKEHELMKHLQNQGLRDLFRHFDARDHQFTWWDFRTRGFERGEGMRIDHILASERLLSRFRNCEIDSAVRGQEKPSDHAPVICEIEI